MEDRLTFVEEFNRNVPDDANLKEKVIDVIRLHLSPLSLEELAELKNILEERTSHLKNSEVRRKILSGEPQIFIRQTHPTR